MTVTQVEKAKVIIDKIESIHKLLTNKNCDDMLFIISNNTHGEEQQSHDIILGRQIIEPYLNDYCGKLKAELRELGVEA